MPDEALTAEEFDGWFSPRALYELLKEHHVTETWRRLVIKRLQDEDLFSAARKATYRRHGRETVAHIDRLPWRHWERSAPRHTHHDFWSSGDIVLDVVGGFHQPDWEISCVDVRFDPEGVLRLIPHPSRWKLVPVDAEVTRDRAAPAEQQQSPKPAPARDARLKIKPATLQAWIADFCAKNPGASFRVVLENARLAHPHLRVTERPTQQIIAELGFKLSTGNPAITRKNR